MDLHGSEGPQDAVLPQPPCGSALGPLVDDDVALGAYVCGVAAGHSIRFHVEGPTLLVDGDIAVGLRLGPAVALVRSDLAGDFDDVRRQVEKALASASMVCLDEDTLLAGPIALQVLGIRLSTWSLWGIDLEEAFAQLRRWAVGDQELPAC